MPPGNPAKKLLAHQKRAAEHLRREVMGADGSLRHPYFRDLDRQLRSYLHPVADSDLAAACSLADLVYVGDYHAVPASQKYAADLLKRIVRHVPRLTVGVEFVYTRQQRILDRRQAGLLSDEDFLRRVHYREEWGYPWEGLRELLDTAREAGVSVHALDSPPRGGFDGLGRRDEHAARRIASILQEQPGTRLLVLFGESHVTRSHLPRRVKTRLKRAGLEPREVTVFQNPDRVYWQMLSREEPLDRPVKVDPSTYAVFHTTPLEKYEAYRQVLDRWRGDVPADEEVDLTPAVHHLIGVLLGWLGIRADRYRLHHRAGWVEDLSDAFPEVYSGHEALELLAPILAEYDRTPEEIEEARLLLSQRGALYEPRSNTLFLLRYVPARAAGEAARFLRAALTGRLFIAPADFKSDAAARAYGAAYNEALAYLGSRLVDPASDYLGWDERSSLVAGAGAVPPASDSELSARIRWLEEHRRFEASRRALPPDELLQPLRGSRPLRRSLARDLGQRLGRVLFERVRGADLEPRQLRNLFMRSLDPSSAPRYVLQLLRRKPRRRSKTSGINSLGRGS